MGGRRVTAGWVSVPPGKSVLTALVPTEMLLEAGAISYYALGLFVLRWWKLAERRRQHRFDVGPLFAAAFWGLVLMMLFRPNSWRDVIVVVLAAALVQLVSPWQAPTRRRSCGCGWAERLLSVPQASRL